MLIHGHQKNAELICLRYGLTCEDSLTLKDLGEHFGVSTETVRRKIDELQKILLSSDVRKLWLKRRAKPYGSSKILLGVCA